METKKAQMEMSRLLLYLAIAVIALLLISYVGYNLITKKSKQFEQGIPKPVPGVPLLAIPFGELMRRWNMQNKRGVTELSPPVIASLIMTIAALLFVAVLVMLFFGIIIIK